MIGFGSLVEISTTRVGSGSFLGIEAILNGESGCSAISSKTLAGTGISTTVVCAAEGADTTRQNVTSPNR